MNKEQARSHFMDYLYDELSPEKRSEFESFISDHPDLKKELNELSEVRSMLAHLPTRDADEQLVLMDPQSSEQLVMDRLRDWVQSLIPVSTFARTGLAMASLILAFFITGASTDLNLSIGNNGFELSFGEPRVVQEGFTPQQVEYLLGQMKQENALMISQAVQSVQENQQQQLEKTLLNFADYMEQQRLSDLNMISTGMVAMEENYSNRFRQTDQVLGEIIQTVSSQ